ncbi:MAG TPA: shikimate kinase [Chlamydiales bacterium]|nr:shikimate kinase [Chlamydiales bacterium]
MNLILFGFKGVGKTFQGRKMSVELGRCFYDTDEMIEDQHKKSVREIFQQYGEEKFRKIEKEILIQLKGVTNSIIAVGGGTVLDSENVSFLQGLGELIYLKTGFETILERILTNGIPSFVDVKNPVESLKILYETRCQIFDTIPARVMNV